MSIIAHSPETPTSYKELEKVFKLTEVQNELNKRNASPAVENRKVKRKEEETGEESE